MLTLRGCLGVLLCVAAVGAGVSPTVAAGKSKARVNFKETTLKNGLRVFLVEDHGAPVFTVDVSYNVGARNEVKGRTGFARLFEHMMFEGSENVGKGEHYYHVFTSGGEMNGFTTPDFTTYFDTLPANQLELGLFLEADRMRSLDVTQEKLDNQRRAVQEERRQRTDNVAYGKSEELQQNLMYDDFAYHHVVIGSMEDLNAASLDDVRQFFKTYYAPNNAKRSLVGGFVTALDVPQSVLSDIVQQQVYGLPPDYWDAYPQRVAAVTAEDVQRVARKYLNPASVQIIAVGDAAKTRAAFEKYGAVEVYDAEGKPVQTGGVK